MATESHSGSDALYCKLVIAAASPETKIWLGEDCGHLVQSAVGVLGTHLLPGEYVVEFGLGTATYPINLTRNSSYTPAEITSSPPCARPTARFASANT